MSRPQALVWLVVLALAVGMLLIAATRPDSSAYREDPDTGRGARSARAGRAEPARNRTAPVDPAPEETSSTAAPVRTEPKPEEREQPMPAPRRSEGERGDRRRSGPAVLSGFVSGAGGERVAGLRMDLRGFGRSNEVFATTWSDASGAYRFDAVDRGRYRLTFGPEGEAIGNAPGLLVLDAGETEHELVVPPLGSLLVEVVHPEDDAPIVGARVKIEDKFGRVWWRETDEQGQVKVPHLLTHSVRAALFRNERRVAQLVRPLVEDRETVIRLEMPPPDPEEEALAERFAKKGKPEGRRRRRDG